MERMRLDRKKRPPKMTACFKYRAEPPEQREQRLAQDRERKRHLRRRDRALAPADATVSRLMQTIADCRAKEKEAWTMLSNYLATGKTVMRERLHQTTPAEEQGMQNGRP